LYAWQGDSNVTLSSDLPFTGTVVQKFWSYSSVAPCVTPNWDMIGATCLYICEDSQNTQFSLFVNQLGGAYDEERGLVFPFDDGSMSCPLTPDMLANVCPTSANSILSTELNVDQMGKSGVIPGMLANYLFSDRSVQIGSHNFKCSISKNCEYQSWSDAPAWGPCSQETNANDTGTRSRFRTIIAQPQFLGDPCVVEEMVEFSQCNRSLTLNSSTDMWCPLYPQNSNAVRSVSEYACHKICKDARTVNGPDACNAFMTYVETPVGGFTPEVFMIEYPVGVSSGSITDQVKLDLPPNYFVSTLPQLQGAWSSGMQTCKEGWFLNSPGNALQATSVQQAGCTNVPDSLSIFVPNQNSPRVWIWGSKENFLNLSLSNITVYPFFSATSAPSYWDPKYTFSNQQFQNQLSCAFFTDRTDILVGDCTSLSANSSVLTSTLFDVPYSFAQNCSLTDWQTVQDCSNTCALAWAQTRTVVNTYSSEGGLPCSRIPTFQSTLCSNFTCPQTFTNVCILNQLPTLSDFATSCSSAEFQADVFLEHFSQSYMYEWAFNVSNTKNVSNLLQYFSSTIRQNALGGSLSLEVIDALNAQCGVTECLSLSSGYFSLSAITFPLGWNALPSGQTCTTDSVVQACLAQRLVQTHVQGKMVYDAGAWICPSTCRPGGLSFSCAMGTPPLDTCVCTPPYLNTPPNQTQSLLYSTYSQGSSLLYSCLLPPQHFVFGCSESQVCEAIQCNNGNDGTPCNSFSRNGECDKDYGTCTCNSPPPTMSKNLCNTGCVRGSNGLQCSGEGTCSYNSTLDDFACVCNPGRSGDACDLAGNGLVGLVEALLYEGTAVVINSSGNNELQSFSFFNPEPRCETRVGSYCAGSQVYSPMLNANNFLFHGYYPPLTRIAGPANGYVYPSINPVDFSNICVNSLDASFNSDWVGANFLSTPLTSFTSGNILPIPCETMVDAKGDLVYTISARFTSNTILPSQLRNKRFYTRCPNFQAYGNASGETYIFQPINQYDAQGNAIFDLVDEKTSLSAFCARV
jgi:hypothetical protein